MVSQEKERDRVADSKKQKQTAMYDLAKLTVKSKEIAHHAKELVHEKHVQDETAKPDAKNASPKNKKTQKTPVSPAKKSVNPQKPLVKVPSMDSGYSSQSQRSNNKPKGKNLVHQNSREVLRNPEDAETASEGSAPEVGKGGTAATHVTFKDSQSVLEFKSKNPLVKQESMGTVSVGFQVLALGCGCVHFHGPFVFRESECHVVGKIEAMVCGRVHFHGPFCIFDG